MIQNQIRDNVFPGCDRDCARNERCAEGQTSKQVLRGSVSENTLNYCTARCFRCEPIRDLYEL